MKTIDKRLKSLEGLDSQFSDVLEWIRQRRYYDELTENEQHRYCQYRGTDRETFHTVETMIAKTTNSIPDFHFLLERKPKPPTPAEFEKIRKEVAELVRQTEIKNRINSL